MINTHLPIAVILIVLVTGLMVPLFGRRHLRFIHTAIFITSCVASLLALISFTEVLHHGSFAYRFGGWAQSVGVEFMVTPLTAGMALLVTGLSTVILVYAFADIPAVVKRRVTPGYYTLVMLMVFGMLGMVYTNDLFNMYVFMEILSISSCAIVTITREPDNLYAGLKYLIIGTIGSITVLFGVALLYMVSGTLNISANGELFPRLWQLYPTNTRMAVAMMLTGFGIKAAVFPMHTWLPDAHSVAPAASSALLSGLVVKVYLVGAVKVLFNVVGVEVLLSTAIPVVLSYIAMAGMLMGSAFAIGQQKIKRILAYSTVAHIGYIVLGISLANEAGVSAAMFHIVTHALMKTALFLSVGVVIHRTGRRYVREFAGVGYRLPLTMTVFSIAALGMIGIPGINGFMSKWYLIIAAVEAGRPIVIPVILISSFLNAVYYLPIITASFMQRSQQTDHIMKRDELPATLSIPLATIGGLCILFGLFPQLIMNVLESSVNALF